MNQEIAMKIKENRCAPRYDPLSSSLFLSQLSEADTDEHHDAILSYRRARLIKSSKSQVHRLR